jgi:predicted Zn finger-like uncharacterized protein
MHLETTCPHCDTRFRVAPDQLRQRGGLVRCGMCQRVFSGLEHLAGDVGAAPGTATDASDPDPFASTESAGRRRAVPVAAWALVLLLSAALLAQLAIGGRDALAARMPALAPAIAAAVGPFGLRVQPPRELDAVTIEAFDLQAGAPGQLIVSALVRNRAAHAVRWPSVELTLTDETGDVLVRRVFAPGELLPEGEREADAGLPPRSERDIRVVLANAGPPPKGYSVSLFHP